MAAISSNQETLDHEPIITMIMRPCENTQLHGYACNYDESSSIYKDSLDNWIVNTKYNIFIE